MWKKSAPLPCRRVTPEAPQCSSRSRAHRREQPRAPLASARGEGGGAEAPAQPGLRRPDGPGVEQMAGGELQQDAPLLQAAAGPARLP